MNTFLCRVATGSYKRIICLRMYGTSGASTTQWQGSLEAMRQLDVAYHPRLPRVCYPVSALEIRILI